MRKLKACVVIPTYNERENIEELLLKIKKVSSKITNWELDILIVDDHSPDQTSDVVKKLQKLHHNIHLLNGPKEGLGKAYIRGFKYALQNIPCDYILEMDADGQHNPEDLPRFLEKAEQNYQFIIGSRYLSTEQKIHWDKKRKLISKIANFVARNIAGIDNIKDCTSGFRCISRAFLESFNLDALKSNGYAFQMDLLHAATKKQISIIEIPINFPDRKKGFSKLGLKDAFEFIFSAFKLRFKQYIFKK
ncbi:MAG: polyprenol monophosphomannose synthase [Candidatus Gracilibacteria bacterium]|jgi:dolichol-phosphate mannosyltransferase